MVLLIQAMIGGKQDFIKPDVEVVLFGLKGVFNTKIFLTPMSLSSCPSTVLPAMFIKYTNI